MNYEPGTVAVATVHGLPNVRVAYADPEDSYMPWMVLAGEHAGQWAYASALTDVRPLVVLDLQDDAYGSPARVVAALRRCPTHDSVSLALADQIEAQTKPPRIPEPGLWGVVEAWTPGIPTRRWVHHEEDRWVCDTGYVARWEGLNEPVLVRLGIEDES